MLNETTIFAVKLLCYSIFAAIGGMLSYTVKTLDAHKKISISELVVQGLVACFFGIIILLLCIEKGVSGNYTGVLVGLSGWLGADITIAIVLQWFKITTNVVNHKGDKDGKDS